MLTCKTAREKLLASYSEIKIVDSFCSPKLGISFGMKFPLKLYLFDFSPLAPEGNSRKVSLSETAQTKTLIFLWLSQFFLVSSESNLVIS